MGLPYNFSVTPTAPKTDLAILQEPHSSTEFDTNMNLKQKDAICNISCPSFGSLHE